MKATYQIQIKTVLLVVFTTFGLSVFGENAEAIEEDYKAKAASACERLNATLRAQGASIAAKQVSQGDTIGASQISEQIESKIKGENVALAHKAIATLFIQYDSARQIALKPIQTVSLERLDALLKTSAGKDMQSVLKIARIREAIEGGKGVDSSETDFKPSKAPQTKEWYYYSSPSMEVINGQLTINDDGTIILSGAPSSTTITKGNWINTNDPKVLAIRLSFGESGTITIKGKTAVYERHGLGTRYLKAK